MRTSTERRLRDLERRLGWRRYRHLPFDQWPEFALASLRADLRRDPAAVRDLSDAHCHELRAALVASLADADDADRKSG